MEIPERVDDVDAGWMDSALRPGGTLGRASVVGLELDYLGEGVGILGELARCRLTYSGPTAGAPESVIVKVPSAHEANRQRGYAFGFYERESRFYDLIGNRGRTGGLRVPRCYANAADAAAGRFVLVLEDMATSFRMSDQVAGIDPADAQTAVESLAGFHVCWWDSDELGALDWLPASNDPVTMQAAPMYRQLWPIFLGKFAHLLPPGGAEVGAAVGERYEWLLDGIAGTDQRTIVHTDFRQDNLFFGDDGTVVVIDWQLMGQGRAVYDVAYLLMQSMDPDTRAQSEHSILRAWHDRVSDLGVKGYTLADAERDYRISALAGLVIPVAAGGDMDLGNERGVALVQHLATRAFRAVMDLDAVSVLG